MSTCALPAKASVRHAALAEWGSGVNVRATGTGVA
jgi:hypothetical protein